MLYAKLKHIRNLAEELDRLERLRNQIEKSPNSDYKKSFYENLKWCKDELDRLSKEDLLDGLDLSDEEKRMAFLYYYKNFEWKDAMHKALNESIRTRICDDESGKLERKTLNALKKHIYKTIQVYYDYQKKKEDKSCHAEPTDRMDNEIKKGENTENPMMWEIFR